MTLLIMFVLPILISGIIFWPFYYLGLYYMKYIDKDKKAGLFLNKIKKRVSKVLAIKIPDEKNAFKTEQINEICDIHSIKCEQINNINDALKYFRSSQQKIYLITGSLYLIGKIRRKLL